MGNDEGWKSSLSSSINYNIFPSVSMTFLSLLASLCRLSVILVIVFFFSYSCIRIFFLMFLTLSHFISMFFFIISLYSFFLSFISCLSCSPITQVIIFFPLFLSSNHIFSSLSSYIPVCMLSSSLLQFFTLFYSLCYCFLSLFLHS